MAGRGKNPFAKKAPPFGMGDKGKAPMGGKDDPKATAAAKKKKAKKK